MKIFIHILVLFILGSISQNAKAQLDSVLLDGVSQKGLHRFSGYSFSQTENSIGIVPSIQGVKNIYLGLGLSRAHFTIGEGGGSGFGATLGADYNPVEQIFAPKLNLWATSFSFFLGGNIGLTGLYYSRGKQTNFVLRPEIGIGYLKVFLNYGHNLFIQDNFESLISKHTFTLSYYHTFLPFKKKGKVAE